MVNILVRFMDGTEEWLNDVASPNLDYEGFVVIESVGEELTHIIPQRAVKYMRITGKARL